ncbi:MAG: thioredoxin family protein, partial [bacterium]
MNTDEIVELNNDNFEIIERKSLSLITFGVSWSVTCNLQNSMVKNVIKIFGDKVFFGTVDVEKSPELKTRYTIETLPSIIVMKNGCEVKRFEGVQRGK